MSPITSSSLLALEENPREVYLEITSLLLRLANNVIDHPSNPKFRSIRLANPTIAIKLLPAVGAMECLFDMGFQEAEDSLVLPDDTSLDKLRNMRDSILSRRNIILSKPTSNVNTSSSQPPQQTSKSQLSQPETPFSSSRSEAKSSSLQVIREKAPFRPVKEEFLRRVSVISESMPHLFCDESIKVAKKYIPLSELEIAAQEQMRKIQRVLKSVQDLKSDTMETEPSIQELLLQQLLSWFKEKFFLWVNCPPCNLCSGETKFKHTRDLANQRTEIYECSSCLQETHFPRLTDPRKLLETRRGRCGEWAKCFTLLCYALGWDARLVCDETDHVWTEVFDPTQNRWVHCDPCEACYDRPLMYECGWGKKLSYIIAYSRDDIQDVTWRYSSNHKEVLQRRNNCSEAELLKTIATLRQCQQQMLSSARKTYLCKRALFELVELMKEPSNDGHYQGRQSGSLQWRLARGEIAFKPYSWTPTQSEIQEKEMRIRYQPGLDQYIRGPSSKELPVQGWQNGSHSVNCVFRKEEHDWKVVYLARAEGSEKGSIQWHFKLSQTGMVVASIKLLCSYAVFQSGQVQVLLCGDNTCVRLPQGQSQLNTSALNGATSVKLSIDLTGGEGSTAWQHAQLFRCDFGSDDVALDVSIKLKPALL